MVESRGMYPMFRTTTPGILAWTSVPCDYCVFSTCCHTQLYPTSKILLPWLVSLDAHRFHEIKGSPADCFTFTLLKAVHDVMTSKNLLALCEVNQPVTGGFASWRACNAELWYFLYCKHDKTVEQTVTLPMIWDTITHHCYAEQW